MKVIAKLSNENNATSITKNSIFIYSENLFEGISALSKKYNQPVILQKFISGYEVTVPVFVSNGDIFIPNVVGSKYGNGLSFGNKIITKTLLEDRIYEDYSNKYYDFSTLNPSLVNLIKRDTELIIKTLDIRSFSRFDLRIDDSFGYYFNDLGSIPGMLPDSSYAFVFDLNDFSYEDFLITTMCMDIPEKVI